MAYSKALILQGILGVTGLCASGAGGIGLGLGKAFGGVQSDASGDDSSVLPEPGALEDIKVDVNDDLGIPEECDTSCSLSAEKLKKLKFAAKEGSSITFEGLEDSDEFELIVEESRDQTNYPKGKKYILRPKTIAGQVTIKNIKEGDIVLGKDQEVVIRETISGRKLEHLLEEVDRLGIPKRCEADQVEGATATTKTCELTQQLQLEKLKFEKRSGEKITVEGLNEGNIVTLKIEDKPNDKDNYTHGKKYTLTSSGGYVLIKGVKGGDVLLEKDKEFVIREKKEGGQLEEVLDEIDGLGIPKRCNVDKVTSITKPCYLIQKQLRDFKFETKEGTSIAVEGWSDISRFKLTIEHKDDDKDNYPHGKKYKLEAITGTAKIKGIKDGDITLWNGQEVVIRETGGGGRLEMAPEEVDELGIPRNCKDSCQLTAEQLKKLKLETRENEEITVEPKNGKFILSIEDRKDDKENYPKGKKYILSARNGQVKIKGLKDGDIEIGTKEGFVIREKEGDEKKLEKAPEEIDKQGIPRRCKSGSTCQLTKEQLEKLKFETQDGSPITIDGLNEGNTVDLKVETPSDVTNYPNSKKYTFTSRTGTVTIKGLKEGEDIEIGAEGVVIREKIGGDKLERAPEGVNKLGIPRWCGAEKVKKVSDTQTCELTQEHLKKFKFGNFGEKSGDVKVEGLTDKITLTISWSDDENNYPGNKKYSFDNTSKNKDIKITKDGEEIKIEKQKETSFKNVGDKLELVEAKDKGQIAKEKKLTEVKEILKKLGFEKLSELSISFTGDTNNPTKYSETKVAEFSSAKGNESDLKKIKFKALGGGATWVTGLNSWNINVYLDWADDASKYPNNMKFSFQNQYFSPFEFKRGSSIVKIPQKKSGTQNPTFKVENYQLVEVTS